MQNLTILKGSWKQTKAKLKIKFAMLTDSDLLIIEGKQEDMLRRLQLRLGMTKEEVYKIISEL